MTTALSPSYEDLYHWCRANAEQYLSPTGEVNATLLAEACAYALGHAGWLDEEVYDVWDAALDAAEESDRLRHG
jgi:hypothetical protein